MALYVSGVLLLYEDITYIHVLQIWDDIDMWHITACHDIFKAWTLRTFLAKASGHMQLLFFYNVNSCSSLNYSRIYGSTAKWKFISSDIYDCVY